MIKLKSNNHNPYAEKLIKVGANDYQEFRQEGRAYKEIICVEPLVYDAMLSTINTYKENYAKTYPIKAAITDKNKEIIDFHVYHNKKDGQKRGKSSSIYRNWKLHEPAKVIQVETRTLSSLVEQHNWQEETFDLILDCEGAELLALKGLGSYIDNARKMQIETFNKPMVVGPYKESSEFVIDEFLKGDFNKVAERRNEGAIGGDTVYLRKGLTFETT